MARNLAEHWYSPGDKGFPVLRVTDALLKAGALELDKKGKRSISTRTPHGVVRLYRIDPDKLILPEDEEVGTSKGTQNGNRS